MLKAINSPLSVFLRETFQIWHDRYGVGWSDFLDWFFCHSFRLERVDRRVPRRFPFIGPVPFFRVNVPSSFEATHRRSGIHVARSRPLWEATLPGSFYPSSKGGFTSVYTYTGGTRVESSKGCECVVDFDTRTVSSRNSCSLMDHFISLH